MSFTNLTPHGPGFSFLDSFEVLEPGRRGRGVKWLDPKAPWFADHFPGNPLMPGVLLVECAAQAAGALWHSAVGFKEPQPLDKPRDSQPLFLAQVQKFRFLRPVKPGEKLESEVVLDKDLGAVAQFEATLRVNGEVVALGVITMGHPSIMGFR